MVQKQEQWVFLIGFSGSGKSSVGRTLAKRLKCRFDDLDLLIEKHTGMAIPEIFEGSGESAFRKLERDVLRKLLTRDKAGVVALGGGAFESRDIRGWTRSHGVTVFLSCSVRELYRRLEGSTNRPLLQVTLTADSPLRQACLARIRMLLSRRLANYRRADLNLSTTNRSVAQAARELDRKLVRLR
jgi:shikimate kinase